MSIIAVLLAIVLPAMSGARRTAMSAACAVRLRELGSALQMYASDYDGKAMPLAYWQYEIIGDGPVLYWWGANGVDGVDHERGFVWPYLQSSLGGGSLFECPEQPWGTYRPQGTARAVTSTYGYNGYYLSPEQTPGWASEIGHQEWLLLSQAKDAARVFAFADTLIDLGGVLPFNNALLDPPKLFLNGSWQRNSNPTTAFRHSLRTQAACVDGHVAQYNSRPDWLISKRFLVGSVGRDNGPHYVPNWRDWKPAN